MEPRSASSSGIEKEKDLTLNFKSCADLKRYVCTQEVFYLIEFYHF